MSGTFVVLVKLIRVVEVLRAVSGVVAGLHLESGGGES